MTKFMQSRSASITLEKAKAINEKAKAEGRPLTETEQSAFDALMAAHSEASLSTEDRIKQDPEYAAGLLNSVVGAYGPKLPGAGGNQPPMLFRTKDGEVVRAYRSTERLVSEPVKDMPSLGGFLAHMLTGKNEFLDGQMAVAAVPGTTASGSYLLSENLAGTVYDLARSASVLNRAGALTVPMDRPTMTIASVASDPTAHWRHETIAVPASGVTFSAINLVPKTLAVVVPLSVEFLEDAPNLPSLLENVIASAFALKIDRAGLYGIGAAAQPWGVLNWPGTNEIPTVGTPSDYSDVSQAITKIYEANFPGDPSSLAWIASPRDLGTYDALVSSSDDQPLQPTPWASKLQKYSTTSLEAAAGATSMVIGDFSQVLFAMRSNGITFEVLREGTVKDVDATEWNATSQLLVHLRAYMRLDTAVIKPQFLTKLTGVTAAG